MNHTAGYVVDLDGVRWQPILWETFHLFSADRQKRLKLLYEREREHDLLLGVAAGLMIHYLMGNYFQWQGTYQLIKNRYGKPGVSGLAGDFNLSHSHNRVIIAGSRGEIGIDLEWGERKLGYRDIARRFFHRREVQWLDGVTTDLKERFFQFWTLKESFIKAIGRGLSFPLNSFEIFRDYMGEFRVKTADLLTPWHLKSEQHDGYHLGLCTDQKSDLNIQKITFNQLIEYALG